MDALAGPYLASAALLVAAGAAKVRDPLPLMRALVTAGVPSRPALAPLVRTGAAVEIALGLVAIGTGHAVAAAGVALSYLAFTGFVLLAMTRGGVLASCGCFGKADTPPTRTHVTVTAALAAVAAVVAVRPLGPLPDLLATAPWNGLPLLLATAAVAATTYLVLALLPVLRVRA
ncbi:MAG: hypothetical protein EPN99_01735 [Frankiales bacterium]|nr:MAG: hypothetical protein EPN99_01735 [Frankiales bacterium]